MGCAGSLQGTQVKQAPKEGKRKGNGGQPLSLSLDSTQSISHSSRRLVLVRRRQELESSQAAWLSQAEKYEDLHLGGYRRIYPAPGTEKYEPFFQQSCSLFQETVSSRAREECARYTAPVGNLLLRGEGGRDRLLLTPSWGQLCCLAEGESWEGLEGQDSAHAVTGAKQLPIGCTPEGQTPYFSDFGT